MSRHMNCSSACSSVSPLGESLNSYHYHLTIHLSKQQAERRKKEFIDILKPSLSLSWFLSFIPLLFLSSSLILYRQESFSVFSLFR